MGPDGPVVNDESDPAAAQTDGEGRSTNPAWAVVAYIVLGALLLFTNWPRPVTPYEIGRSIGGLLIPLAIGFGIWQLIRRIRGKGERWSPWILFIAWLLSGALSAGQRAESLPQQQGGLSASQPVDAVTASELFAPEGGYRFVNPGRRLAREAKERMLATQQETDVSLVHMVKMVMRGNRSQGMVISSIVDSSATEAQAQEFRNGFLKPAPSELDDARPLRIGPADAFAGTFQSDGQSTPAVIFAFRNVTGIVLSSTERSAERIVELLVDDMSST